MSNIKVKTNKINRFNNKLQFPWGIMEFDAEGYSEMLEENIKNYDIGAYSLKAEIKEYTQIVGHEEKVKQSIDVVNKKIEEEKLEERKDHVPLKGKALKEMEEELKSKTAPDLRKLAKELGLPNKGYRHLNKEKLVKLLAKNI